MSEMVDQVAKAMCENRKFVWSNCDKAYWRGAAKAAIEAMRELPEEPGPRYTAGEYSRRTQSSMVDDALK